MPFIPITEEEQKEMLKTIGMDFEGLIESIPKDIRVKTDFNLPSPLSEMEVVNLMKEIAGKNKFQDDFVYFMGGGAYDHYIPSVINHILIRPEFYTAYTPYQPEVSQGTLQAIYEYQSMICDLTGMDVTNASMYDGATALAEAVHMAREITGKDNAVISTNIHPYYKTVIKTYTEGMKIPLKYTRTYGKTPLEEIESLIDEETACVVVQHPDFFGILEDVDEIADISHKKNVLFIVSYNPISLGILKPPGEYGADIATGEGQPLGLPLSFGGPYLGLFSAKREFIRKMPGRIIGQTTDVNGKRGFVMTLQTREQHIRRARATSNICTNNGLCALASVVYLALMGKRGIYKVANHSIQKAHYLKEGLKNAGAEFPFEHPFFNEFVIKTKIEVTKFIEKMMEKGFLPGIPLEKFNPEWKDYLLIAITEKRSKQDLDRYIEEYSKIE